MGRGRSKDHKLINKYIWLKPSPVGSYDLLSKDLRMLANLQKMEMHILDIMWFVFLMKQSCKLNHFKILSRVLNSIPRKKLVNYRDQLIDWIQKLKKFALKLTIIRLIDVGIGDTDKVFGINNKPQKKFDSIKHEHPQENNPLIDVNYYKLYNWCGI